jgi:uncharacterized protein RhaS with RHS repeats
MYNPTVGRFLEEDPIQFQAGDTDLYRYVRNTPTNRNDPTGEGGPFDNATTILGPVLDLLGFPIARFSDFALSDRTPGKFVQASIKSYWRVPQGTKAFFEINTYWRDFDPNTDPIKPVVEVFEQKRFAKAGDDASRTLNATFKLEAGHKYSFLALVEYKGWFPNKPFFINAPQLSGYAGLFGANITVPR